LEPAERRTRKGELFQLAQWALNKERAA